MASTGTHGSTGLDFSRRMECNRCDFRARIPSSEEWQGAPTIVAFGDNAWLGLLQHPRLSSTDKEMISWRNQATACYGPSSEGLLSFCRHLTGDALVDLLDRDAWLAEAGGINLGAGRVYRLGEANLDSVVDGSDFDIWNANKFTSADAPDRVGHPLAAPTLPYGSRLNAYSRMPEEMAAVDTAIARMFIPPSPQARREGVTPLNSVAACVPARGGSTMSMLKIPRMKSGDVWKKRRSRENPRIHSSEKFPTNSRQVGNLCPQHHRCHHTMVAPATIGRPYTIAHQDGEPAGDATTNHQFSKLS